MKELRAISASALVSTHPVGYAAFSSAQALSTGERVQEELNRMRSIVLVCFLGLGLLQAGCASPSEDRVETWARSRPSIGPSLELLARGDALFAAGNYEEARHLYAKATRAVGPASAYVEACAQMARTLSLLGESGEGEPWMRMALARARNAEPLGWSRVQLVLGVFEREEGVLESARTRFLTLYDYCLQHDLYERAVEAAHQMVLAAPDVETQMRWSRKGIDAAEQGGMNPWLATKWFEMATSLEKQGRSEQALIAYQESNRYRQLDGTDREKLIGEWAVGRALRRTGRVDEAMEVSKSVLPRAEERYAAAPVPEEAERLGYARWERAELDWVFGNYGLALTGLEEARQKLIEADIGTRGEVGRAKLAHLDLRIERLKSEMP